MSIDPSGKQLESAMQVLSTWNPLGERAAVVPDLHGYRAEACDILFHFEMAGSREAAVTIVQEVLSEAFHLELTRADCEAPALELWRIYQESTF